MKQFRIFVFSLYFQALFFFLSRKYTLDILQSVKHRNICNEIDIASFKLVELSGLYVNIFDCCTVREKNLKEGKVKGVMSDLFSY